MALQDLLDKFFGPKTFEAFTKRAQRKRVSAVEVKLCREYAGTDNLPIDVTYARLSAGNIRLRLPGYEGYMGGYAIVHREMIDFYAAVENYIEMISFYAAVEDTIGAARRLQESGFDVNIDVRARAGNVTEISEWYKHHKEDMFVGYPALQKASFKPLFKAYDPVFKAYQLDVDSVLNLKNLTDAQD